MKLDGKVALVTGGGGGLGRAISLCLASAGCPVALSYFKNQHNALEIVREIEALGGTALAFSVDLGDSKAIRWALKDVVHTFGQIDLVVNQAACFGEVRPLDEIDDEAFASLIAFNLMGAFYICREVLPHLPRGGPARILNLTATSIRGGGGLGAHYAASKAGLEGLSMALAKELSPRGISVNVLRVAPALTKRNEARRAELEVFAPSGRLALPSEVATSVRFLLENDYLNGALLDMSGDAQGNGGH